MSDETTVNAATQTTATTETAAPAATVESVLAVATEAKTTEGQGTTTQAPEQKAALDAAAKTDADKAAEGEKGKETVGAPEKYELKAPEGMKLDEGLMAKFEPIFRKGNISNEVAQEIANAYGDVQKEFETQIKESWVNQNVEWVKEVKADLVFGGTKYDLNLATAQSAVAWIGSKLPGYQDWVKEVGNHPFLIKAHMILGEAMKEDGIPKATLTTEKEGNSFFPGSKRI